VVFSLTQAEAANVRIAARFLRAKMGGWANVAKALRVDRTTASRAPTPIMAFRLARLVGIGVDDVLTGKFPPPGTCPHCGHRSDEHAQGRP
jgi:hypothetical protein